MATGLLGAQSTRGAPPNCHSSGSRNSRLRTSSPVTLGPSKVLPVACQQHASHPKLRAIPRTSAGAKRRSLTPFNGATIEQIHAIRTILGSFAVNDVRMQNRNGAAMKAVLRIVCQLIKWRRLRAGNIEMVGQEKAVPGPASKLARSGSKLLRQGPVHPFGGLATTMTTPSSLHRGPWLCVPASRLVCLCRG